MPTSPQDEALIAALRQYGNVRRRISRDIHEQIPAIPAFGGRELLQRIPGTERPNVTALSDATGITRGGVSKAMARLRQAGLVEGYQLPENRKEVYYCLTPQGEETLLRLKEALDALQAEEMAYLGGLPEGEKKIILRFLGGFVRHLEDMERRNGKEGDA